MAMDIRKINREAWNHLVETGSPWTIPVSSAEIEKARQGRWQIFLTPTKPVPGSWFPALAGTDVLCLACGGGQQGPILAALGAHVTILDNSPRQLARDREVAQRDCLDLSTLEGDMSNLWQISAESVDLIFHPVSNTYVADVRPVWKECYRVLRHGGSLLAGFTNPIVYLFDWQLAEQGLLQAKFTLPYSDAANMDEEALAKWIAEGHPLEFSHTLEAQVNGQIEAGFLLAGFYEDIDPDSPLSKFTTSYIATRAVKL
jgi:SAM-dependent methyltransferase